MCLGGVVVHDGDAEIHVMGGGRQGVQQLTQLEATVLGEDEEGEWCW